MCPALNTSQSFFTLARGGNCHGNHPDYHSDPCADRRPAYLELQQSLGTLSQRRYRLDSADLGNSLVDGANLKWTGNTAKHAHRAN